MKFEYCEDDMKKAFEEGKVEACFQIREELEDELEEKYDFSAEQIIAYRKGIEHAIDIVMNICKG